MQLPWNRLSGNHEKMYEYAFCVKQKKEDSYIFYWVRWQQIINPWIRFLCVQKKEDSGINRQGRYLRIGHWHFRKKWKLFHKFAQGNMIWLRRKFIWKSFSFVLVTVWCTAGFGIYGKCSSESSRANRTWWRNIHRPTDEAVRTSLPWPT